MQGAGGQVHGNAFEGLALVRKPGSVARRRPKISSDATCVVIHHIVVVSKQSPPGWPGNWVWASGTGEVRIDLGDIGAARFIGPPLKTFCFRSIDAS